MARKARYTKALPVYVTPEVRSQLDLIADRHDISVAEVTRRVITIGLSEMTPEGWANLYD